MAFQILVDTQQQRVSFPGVSTLVGKQDWDLAWCFTNNTYMDGSTGTVMLTPGFLDGTNNWNTLNTGIYAKLPPTDYTLTPSSGWKIPALNVDGSQWLKFVNNTSGAGAITTYSVAVNQAIVVSLYVGNGTANTDVAGDVGWGASGDATTGVSLRFYQNGSVDIWKAGAKLASNLTLSGQNADYGQSDGQIPSQTQNQYITFLLIPCRERELLILSSNGGGYCYTFLDIPEGNPGGLPITPSAPIWFYAAPGVDTTWQLALCQYASSGNAIGKQSFWRYDPGATPMGGFQQFLNQDLYGGTTSMLVADGVAPGSPYANNTNGVRLNVTLTGSSVSSGPYSPTTTPFLYAAQAYTYARLDKTTNVPLDVTTYALECSLSFADSISGARGHLNLKDPLGIVAAGVALDGTNKPGHLIQSLSNRPWQIWDGSGNQLLEGRNASPDYHKGTYVDPTTGNPLWGTATNPAEMVSFELRDLWDQAEKYVFEDQYPLDGYTLGFALTLLTDLMGITDSHSMGGFSGGWSISPALANYVLPKGGSVTDSEFNNMVESGDKGSEVLDRLFKSYAANAFFALVPMNGWCQPTLLLPPASSGGSPFLPSSPTQNWYDSAATAIAHGISTPTYLNLFRSVEVKMLEPEANDCYVQGYDYRLLRPIMAHNVDTVNSDPTIIPANRTPKWLGEIRAYAWNDPSLSTQAACNYALGLIFARISIARSIIEIEAEYAPGFMRGSLAQLFFAANGGVINATSGSLTQNPVCRVKTVEIRFVYTGNDGIQFAWQPTKYVLQADTDSSVLNTHGTTVSQIWQEWAIKILSKTTWKIDDNDKNTWRRPYSSQSGP